jgi:hypothetical protein
LWSAYRKFEGEETMRMGEDEEALRRHGGSAHAPCHVPR